MSTQLPPPAQHRTSRAVITGEVICVLAAAGLHFVHGVRIGMTPEAWVWWMPGWPLLQRPA